MTYYNSRHVLMTNSAGTFSGTLLSPKSPEDRPYKASEALPLPVDAAMKPLVILMSGFPDLPEPSLQPLAEFLVRFQRTVCLIPHSRGYEVSSVQKQPGWWDYRSKPSPGLCRRKGYTVAELASDLLDWIAELQERKFVSKTQGIILIGHDWGSVICQAATALYHFRRHSLGGANTNNVDSADKHRPIIRGLVLLAIPPLQNFWWYAIFVYPIQQLLLRSWYMLFFQLPWIPEWTLKRTNLLRWLWRRWSPSMDSRVVEHRADGVKRHLLVGGTPRAEIIESARRANELDEERRTEKAREEMAEIDGTSNTKASLSAEALPPTAPVDRILAVPYRSTSIAPSKGNKDNDATQCLVAALAYYRCLLSPTMTGLFSIDLMFGSKQWALDARTTPTLCIAGIEDGCIHPDVFKACCDSVTRGLSGVELQGTTCVLVPKAGHWVHLEQPSVVCSKVGQFVSDIAGSTDA